MKDGDNDGKNIGAGIIAPVLALILLFVPSAPGRAQDRAEMVRGKGSTSGSPPGIACSPG